MYFLLRQRYALRIFSRDEDFFRVSSLGTTWTVSVDLREWRREIDGSIGSRFNELDVFPSSSANNCME